MLSVAGVLRSQDGNEKQITKGGSHFDTAFRQQCRRTGCRVVVLTFTRVCAQ